MYQCLFFYCSSKVKTLLPKENIPLNSIKLILKHGLMTRQKFRKKHAIKIPRMNPLDVYERWIRL